MSYSVSRKMKWGKTHERGTWKNLFYKGKDDVRKNMWFFFDILRNKYLIFKLKKSKLKYVKRYIYLISPIKNEPVLLTLSLDFVFYFDY
jgi:hypothetical protein